MSAFDSGLNIGAGAAAKQVEFANQQRVAGRNAQAALIENALNNPDTAPADRAALLQQHAALFQPHEAPDLFKRLSGLIHGQQPAPTTATAVVDPNAAPVAPPQPLPKDLLGIPITDPTVAAAHAEPMHPMATSHPILDRFNEGLDALGNHLKGFAQPTAPPTAAAKAADADVLARNYVSPTTVARETLEQRAQAAQELAATKGQYGITQAEVRGGAVRGVAGHPLALASAQNLADNGEIFIDKNTGKPLDLDDVQTAVPGAQLTPYYQGARLLGYEVSDQNGHIITADNVKKVVGLGGKALPGADVLGAATVPKDVSSRSSDQYGNVTTTQRRTAPETPAQPVSNAAPTIPGQPPPSPNVIPGAPELAAINAGIQANKGKAGAPSRKAAGGTQPISSAAPRGPAILDANDQIPASAAPNAQVRQFAQDLLDDRDVAQIPAKARAAAEQVARQFGWSQGAFTPREQRAINLTGDFLDQFAKSPSLKILDSPILRAEAVTALHHADGLAGQQLQSFLTHIENPAVAEFVRLYNANVNNVTGASSTIRPGRPTEALVKRLGTELPTVLQAKDSADAKARIKLLQNAITDAQKSSRLKSVGGGQAPQTLTDRLNEALGK